MKSELTFNCSLSDFYHVCSSCKYPWEGLLFLETSFINAIFIKSEKSIEETESIIHIYFLLLRNINH